MYIITLQFFNSLLLDHALLLSLLAKKTDLKRARPRVVSLFKIKADGSQTVRHLVQLYWFGFEQRRAIFQRDATLYNFIISLVKSAII